MADAETRERRRGDLASLRRVVQVPPVRLRVGRAGERHGRLQIDAGIGQGLLERAAEAVELDGSGELRFLEELPLPRVEVADPDPFAAHVGAPVASDERHLPELLDPEGARQVAAERAGRATVTPLLARTLPAAHGEHRPLHGPTGA